jgi:hypothetical protein
VFVPAAGEAAGPPKIPRECIGGPAASPAAGTKVSYGHSISGSTFRSLKATPREHPGSSPHCRSHQ